MNRRAQRNSMPLAVMAAVALILWACSPREQTWTDGRPTRVEINQIESALVMPEGADSLHVYSRFYAAKTHDGRRTIVGEFVQPMFVASLLAHRTILETVSPSVFIVDANNMPGIRDGGCGVITLSYNPDSGVMTPPTCNGDA